MKKIVLLLSIVLLNGICTVLFCQSVTIYLCNDCTYESVKDGETITFMVNGMVKINGKINPNFSCRNNDGIVELRYKGKLINNLNWYKAQSKGYTLLDDRGIGYNLIKCTGDMPPMWEINNPEKKKKKRKDL